MQFFTSVVELVSRQADLVRVCSLWGTVLLESILRSSKVSCSTKQLSFS
jgi:hypothetical protein